MNRTSIEWVKNPDGSQGYTWNPITGCLNGCEYCYARKLANGRLKARYLANQNIAPEQYIGDRSWGLKNPFYPRIWLEKLVTHPRRNPSPRGIFVCDMGDLFGIAVPEGWTRRVLEFCRVNDKHRFYLLTKQPQNLAKFGPYPDNCWVGVSSTDAQMFIDAGHALEDTHAKVKYISAEPLLDWDLGGAGFIATMLQQWGISWIIIGAQTKPFRPPKIEWVKEIVSAADKAGIPVFLKDNLAPLIKAEKGENFYLRQEMPAA